MQIDSFHSVFEKDFNPDRSVLILSSEMGQKQFRFIFQIIPSSPISIKSFPNIKKRLPVQTLFHFHYFHVISEFRFIIRLKPDPERTSAGAFALSRELS